MIDSNKYKYLLQRVRGAVTINLLLYLFVLSENRLDFPEALAGQNWVTWPTVAAEEIRKINTGIPNSWGK